MILVVGATGALGSEICRRLVNHNKSVRAFVRRTADPAKINYLKALNVTFAYGDLKDRASLDTACQGVHAVITTATVMQSRQPDDSIEATDRVGQCNLVAAAKAAGVHHFVYISYTKSVNLEDSCPLILAKRIVEQQLQESGMIYTILRPCFFMDVWLSPLLGFDYPNAKALIYGIGYNKNSLIVRQDVAEFAVQSLDNPVAHNAILELGGPQALSPLDIVTIFEEQSGRPFELTNISVAVLQTQTTAATDSLQKSATALKLSYAAGSPINMDEIRSVFSISLTSVRDYARRMLTSRII